MYELSITSTIEGQLYKPQDICAALAKRPGSEVFEILPQICIPSAIHHYSLYKLNTDGLAVHISDKNTVQQALDVYAVLSGVSDPMQLYEDRIYQTLPESPVTDPDLMIFWEWVLENRDYYTYLDEGFKQLGTCEMRDRVAHTARRVISILDKLTKTSFKHCEITQQVPYDWELIPALLDQYYRYPVISDTQLSILFSVALSKLHKG